MLSSQSKNMNFKIEKIKLSKKALLKCTFTFHRKNLIFVNYYSENSKNLSNKYL